MPTIPLADAAVTYRGTSDDVGASWVKAYLDDRVGDGKAPDPRVPIRPQIFRPLSELFFSVGTGGNNLSLPASSSASESSSSTLKANDSGNSKVKPVHVPQRLIPCTPRNVIEEIESYYCPQCLENFPSSEAMSFRARCPRGECFTCAICSSPSLPTEEKGRYYFSCKMCRWNSIKSGLVGDSEPNLVALALSREQGPQVQYVRYITKELQKSLQDQEKKIVLRKRLSGRSTASVRSAIFLKIASLEHGKAPDNFGKWRVADVEERLNQQSSAPGGVVVESTKSGEGKKNGDHRVSRVAVEKVDPPWLSKIESKAADQFSEMPHRTRLRSKKSYRCRVMFSLGYPGILLKSHINPLTGDSSMRAHMGNWFKKSSFARSFIPRLTVRSVTRHEDSSSKEKSEDVWNVELTLTNPLDEDVMVTLFRVSRDTSSPGLESLEDDECEVFDSLDEVPFLLRQHDELQEQDWNDSSVNSVNGDPSFVVERKNNKVVFKVAMACPRSMGENSQTRVAFFRLGIRAKSATAEELAIALGEDSASMAVGRVGLEIEYETRVKLQFKRPFIP